MMTFFKLNCERLLQCQCPMKSPELCQIKKPQSLEVSSNCLVPFKEGLILWGSPWQRSFLGLGPHLSSTCCLSSPFSSLWSITWKQPLSETTSSTRSSCFSTSHLSVCVRFFWLTIKMPYPWNSLCLGMCLTHLFKILADSGRLCYGYIMEIMANIINIWKLVKLVQRMKH